MDDFEDFVSNIENFRLTTASEQCDFFVFYLTVCKERKGVTSKDIEECFDELRLKKYSNIPQYLNVNSKRQKNKSQKFISSGKLYTLERNYEELLKTRIITDQPKIKLSNDLRSLVFRVSNQNENEFLKEAVKTFEVEAYRASIIMVWILTLDHLYEYVLANKVQDFISSLRRMGNQKSIRSKDDFSDIKESVFIEACRGADIISNDVRKILEAKLGIRNSYAHPSTVQLPQSKALEFISTWVKLL